MIICLGTKILCKFKSIVKARLCSLTLSHMHSNKTLKFYVIIISCMFLYGL